VYSMRGHTAFACIRNGRSWLFADSSMFADTKAATRHIAPFDFLAGVAVTTECVLPQGLPSGGKLVQWQGKMIVIADRPGIRFPLGAYADYLIIRNNAIQSLSEIHTKIHFKHVILDGPVNDALTDRLMAEAVSLKIRIHAVHKNGAYVTSLE